MSLNKFSELFQNLDSSNSTNKKLEILINYFSAKALSGLTEKVLSDYLRKKFFNF